MKLVEQVRIDILESNFAIQSQRIELKKSQAMNDRLKKKYNQKRDMCQQLSDDILKM